MLDTIFGLPAHPLIVHATAVMVPLATLAVLLAGVWPRFRRWAGWLPLALSLVSLVLTPLSTQSGEPFRRRVTDTALVQAHTQMAEGLLPWVLGLVVAAVLTTVVWRRSRIAGGSQDGAERLVDEDDHRRAMSSRTPRWVPIVVAVVAVVAATGTAVQVVRIGHSGAEAVWSQAGAKVVTRAPGGGDEDSR
ncbi:MAG: DUF2231 domain-containing protein [Lapillicoccus sp.]